MGVNIGAYQITDYQGAGTTAEFRWYAGKSWTDASGVRRIKGSIDSRDSYQQVAGNVVGNTIQMESHVTPTTDDALDNNDVRVSLVVYVDGKYYSTILKRVIVSTELGGSATVEDIRLYNNQTIRHTPEETFQREVFAYLANLQLAPVASRLLLGRTRLTVDPISAPDPVAVGDNDPRVRDNLVNYFGNFQAAITALTGTESVLRVNAPTAVPANVTVPREICIELGSRGSLIPATGVTITVNKLIDCGNRLVFNVTASNSKVLLGRGAVSKINVAWYCGVTNGTDATRAINLALESCSLNDGGIVFLPEVRYVSSGGHTIPKATSIVGCGDFITAGYGGTQVTLVAPTATYLFKVGALTYDTGISDLTMHTTLTGGYSALLLEGHVNNGSSGKLALKQVTFSLFDFGVNYNTLSSSPDSTWQMAQVSMNNCRFVACAVGIRQTSVNSSWSIVNTNFYIPANGWAMTFSNAGITTFKSCEFAGQGANAKVIRADGAHVQVNFLGCQEEGNVTFIENNASDVSGIFNLYGNLIQSKIQLNASCKLNSYGNNYLSKVFKFGGVGTVCAIISEGDFVQSRDVADGVTVVNPPVLTEGGLNDTHIVRQSNPVLNYFAQRLPQRFISTILQQADTDPIVEIGNVHDGATTYNRALLRAGRRASDGSWSSNLYYDIYRSDVTGWLTFQGAQASPFKGFTFNAPVETTVDHAYDRPSWNGLLEFPTKNAVSDIIESIIADIADIRDGYAFTGGVSAPTVAVGGGTTLTKLVKGVVNINPANLAAGAYATETVSLTGVAVGDSLQLNPPSAGLTAGLLLMQHFVSATNQIKVVFYNASVAAIDEPAANWDYSLIRS